MQLASAFYDRICCEPRAYFPDPYAFQFGSSRISNPLFQSNKIRTSKYNLLNFLPKSLLTQYRRLANVYFVIVASIATIPGISPLNPVLIWFPLVAVLAISIIKQAYEDYQRHKMDKITNQEWTTCVLREGQIKKLKWEDIEVGDLCLVYQGQFFPADLVLISSSHIDGLAFIETATLDGEQTSKARYAFPELNTYRDSQAFRKIEGTFESQGPNELLDMFRADLRFGRHTLALTDNRQLLFRSAKLKNTQWIWGLVAFTGQCSKIMLNGHNSSTKLSSIESKLNYLLAALLVCLMITCIIMAIISLNYELKMRGTHHYMDWQSNTNTNYLFWTKFFLYFVEYSSLIPVSLIVSIEIAKVAQSYFIDFDQLMFSPWRAKKVYARIAALNEQLGQVEYIFTDKTGTLTKNKMTFQTAVIGSKAFEFSHNQSTKQYYSQPFETFQEKKCISRRDAIQKIHLTSQDMEDNLDIKDYRELTEYYMLCLLLCNKVTITQRQNKANYESESPDQLSLINFAKSMGYVLLARDNSSVLVSVRGVQSRVKIFGEFSFSSQRKRMSVMVEWKGKILLLIKGADNVIAQRINPSQFRTEEQINSMSKRGLRTMMLAMRVISKHQLAQFQDSFSISRTQKRDTVVQEYALKFEDKMQLIGATGLLDELQDGVPQTLNDFLRANIRVWMLTGDKLETATEIARACNLIRQEYELIELPCSREPIRNVLKNCRHQIRDPSKQYALIIEGSELTKILADEYIAGQFALMSQQFATVICCRLLPIQKSMVVGLIRNRLKRICLAVGDGGNDVSMLKQANIGVGVYGEEGMSAVQASDYCIPQFRMLWRLLFVHGRWNYMRVCDMILYFCYKSMLFTVARFFFTFENGYSGLPLFDDYYIALYNIAFTAIPLLIRALFEQDVSYICQKSQTKMKESNNNITRQQAKYLPPGFVIDGNLRNAFPKIYFLGQNNEIFNVKYVLLWLGEAAIMGGITFYSIIYFVGGSTAINQHGHNGSLSLLSIIVYSTIIVLDTIKICIEIRHWTKLLFFSVIVMSLMPYFAFIWIANFYFKRPIQLTIIMSFASAKTYIAVALIVMLAVALDNVIVSVRFSQSKILRKMIRSIQKQVSFNGKTGKIDGSEISSEYSKQRVHKQEKERPIVKAKVEMLTIYSSDNNLRPPV